MAKKSASNDAIELAGICIEMISKVKTAMQLLDKGEKPQAVKCLLEAAVKEATEHLKGAAVWK